MDFEKQIKQNREFMKRGFIDWKELERHETEQAHELKGKKTFARYYSGKLDSCVGKKHTY